MEEDEEGTDGEGEPGKIFGVTDGRTASGRIFPGVFVEAGGECSGLTFAVGAYPEVEGVG